MYVLFSSIDSFPTVLVPYLLVRDAYWVSGVSYSV